MNLFSRYGKCARTIVSGILFLGAFFCIGAESAEAAPVKILSDSRHAYNTIISTINQLMGTGHIGTDFIVHSTNMSDPGGFSASAGNALNTTTQRYDHNGTLVPSAGPYQLYTTSATGYPGDSTSTYNSYSIYDLAHNYAFANNPVPPATRLPPAFFISPGGAGYASNYGVEWKLDPAIFCSGSLSCATAANAGLMAVLRFNHPTWNWFDVKAALRQTGTNWATGYNHTTYGFGQVNHTAADALTDGQISLQPPVAYGSVISGKISFTLYPFKQTRRVKEVLFQFPSAPSFHAGEFTLSEIEALGGTKITEYTGTTATTMTPVYNAVTNAYFVWFTADDATDSAASFSRIDTYNVRGPFSQNERSFEGVSYSVSPEDNAVTTSASPTFSWTAVTSYFGVEKYQLFIDGVLDTDNISGTSTTPTTPLSEGSHTWYVKVINGIGSSITTATRTINVNTGYASGYTFYVDNVSGDDNNPGTQASPWTTLAKAGVTVSAGDTVVIVRNAGVPYRETIDSSSGGTESLPITFRGADTASKPEIWGSDDVSTGWTAYGGGNPDTYQYATTTNVQVVAVGPSISSLTKKTQGSAAATLNPGEWYWASNVLYYRLAAGEVMGSLHIEASMRNHVISAGSYELYKDIVVRYANDYGVSFAGGAVVAHGVEVYDSLGGFLFENWSGDIESDAYDNVVRYSIAARNKNYGFKLYSPFSGSVHHSVFHGNTAGGGNAYTWFSDVASRMRNNIFSGNGNQSVSTSFNFARTLLLTASNNLWDIAGDSFWTANKGTDNQELVDPLLVNPDSDDFALQAFSPAIDAGTTISGLATDIIGNPVYGAPDIGPYEYQPPYDMDTDQPNSSVSIRMYGDGKFRNLSAPSGSDTVPLSISSDGNDRSQWLDLDVSEWTSDHKEWMETSPNLTGDTEHAVGGLDPDTYYEIEVDSVSGAGIAGLNCSSAGMCLSDSAGEIVFSYSGGYSTHTFEMTRRPDADPLLFAGTPAGTVVAGTTSSSIALSTLENSTCRYATEAGVDYADMSGSFSATGTTAHSTSIDGLASGQSYVYYVKCLSSAGNIAGDYAISFSVALDELADELDIDSPRARIGDEERFPLDKTTYISDKKFDLSATTPDIAGGTVEISRNGGLYKTVRVADSGKWSVGLRTKKEGANTFDIVYRNADGTIVSSQKRVVRVDTKKPVFVSFPTIPVRTDAGTTRISWNASDNDRIARYKVYFAGRIYSLTGKEFLVPKRTERGWHMLRVRAIDRSGNVAERSVPVFVR